MYLFLVIFLVYSWKKSKKPLSFPEEKVDSLEVVVVQM